MPTFPNQVDNPFTLVYDALWQMVELNTRLTPYLKSKEKFDDRDGAQRNINTADTPELMLIQQVRTGQLKISSTETEIIPTYSFLLMAGDQRLNRVLNQINWELFRSLTDWNSVLCALQWPPEAPKKFIIQATLVDATDSPPGFTEVEERDTIRSWTSIWTIAVQMRFATSNLRLP